MRKIPLPKKNFTPKRTLSDYRCSFNTLERILCVPSSGFGLWPYGIPRLLIIRGIAWFLNLRKKFTNAHGLGLSMIYSVSRRLLNYYSIIHSKIIDSTYLSSIAIESLYFAPGAHTRVLTLHVTTVPEALQARQGASRSVEPRLLIYIL